MIGGNGSTSDVGGMGNLDPDTIRQLLALNGVQTGNKQNDRTYAMADALRKQSMTPQQGIHTGNTFVAASPISAITNAAQGLMANQMQQQGDQRASMLDQQKQDAYARYLQSMTGGPRGRAMPTTPQMQQPTPAAGVPGAGAAAGQQANPMADLDPNDPSIQALLRQQMAGY